MGAIHDLQLSGETPLTPVDIEGDTWCDQAVFLVKGLID